MIKEDQEALICTSTTRKVQANNGQVYPEKDFFQLAARTLDLQIEFKQYGETLFVTILHGERLSEFLNKLYELAGSREAFYKKSSSKERG